MMKRNADKRKMRDLEEKKCDNYIKVSFVEEEEEIYYIGYNLYQCEFRNYISYIEVNGTIISDAEEEISLSKGMNIKYCFNSSVTSLEYFFSENCDENYYLIQSIDLTHFDSTQLTKMNSMFYGCFALNSIEFNDFSTSSVVNMSELFYGCSSLKDLTLANFQTSKVTNMNSMFNGCSSLESITLSKFDTSLVTDMNSMFYECSSLNSIDLSNFNTSLVKNMASMFNKCSKLITLDLSKFNTSSVTNMNSMFNGCSNLNSTILSNFVTSSVTDMSSMFEGCEKLISINLENFDTSLVTNMQSMFDKNFIILGISNFNFSSITNTKCIELISDSVSTKLGYIDIYNISFSSKYKSIQTYFNRYFKNFDDLTVCQPDNSEFIKEKYTKCCDFLIELGKCEPVNYISVNYSDNVNYEKFNTVSREGKVKYLNITYGDSTYKIIKPDENFTIPANTTVNIYLRYNVTNLDEFFSSSDSNAKYISSINGFEFESLEVNSSKFMFSECTGLKTIKLNGFKTGKIRDMSGMFSGCSSLTTFALSIDTSSLINMNSMFSGCTSLKTVGLPDIDIEKSLKANNDTENFYMEELFNGCGQLKEIHFEHVVAKTNKYSSNNMISDCPSLENIYMNNFHYLNNIFKESDNNITSLKYINLDNCIQSYYSEERELFKNKEDLIICQKKAPNKTPLMYNALICCDYETDPDLCYPVETTIFTTTPNDKDRSDNKENEKNSSDNKENDKDRSDNKESDKDRPDNKESDIKKMRRIQLIIKKMIKIDQIIKKVIKIDLIIKKVIKIQLIIKKMRRILLMKQKVIKILLIIKKMRKILLMAKKRIKFQLIIKKMIKFLLIIKKMIKFLLIIKKMIKILLIIKKTKKMPLIKLLIMLFMFPIQLGIRNRITLITLQIRLMKV